MKIHAFFRKSISLTCPRTLALRQIDQGSAKIIRKHTLQSQCRDDPRNSPGKIGTPLGPGAVLFDWMTRRSRDHARLFKNRTWDIEIDPKSIYVHILKPRPDRPPQELVKNHQKSPKSQFFRYFSKFSSNGSSRIVTERPITRKICIFFWSLQLAIQLRVSGTESIRASENKCLKF